MCSSYSLCNPPEQFSTTETIMRFIEDIENGAFEPYKAHVSVIEFQKRGAPHVHALVWLNGLYLPQSVVSHGHLYVLISRYGDPDNVFVYADQAEFENASHLLDEDNNMSDVNNVGHVT